MVWLDQMEQWIMGECKRDPSLWPQLGVCLCNRWPQRSTNELRVTQIVIALEIVKIDTKETQN